MKKLLICIIVPSIEQQFDVLLSTFLTVKETCSLISSGVEEISSHRYCASGNELLCWVEEDRLLVEDIIIGRYGIRNGDHLMLF